MRATRRLNNEEKNHGEIVKADKNTLLETKSLVKQQDVPPRCLHVKREVTTSLRLKGEAVGDI